MKIVVIDITGRNAAQYNPSLCRSISKQIGAGNVLLYSPTHFGDENGYIWKKLFTFIPESSTSSSSPIKRIVRAFETIFNYFILICVFSFNKPDVIHFQWLPFLEYSDIEAYFLRIIRFVCPKSKVFLTIHNVFPHSSLPEDYTRYIKNFKSVDKFIDGYLVHLLNTKTVIVETFGVSQNKIFLAYHGLYEAKGYKLTSESNKNDKLKIILYGFQSRYKGTDVYLEALKLMPPRYLEKLESLIIGQSDMSIYNNYSSQLSCLNVQWINKYVAEEVLYSAIGESDLILLPYRQITQSGVLLLALAYNKPILTSDLPSFRETLNGYPKDYFFEADNPVALKDVLQRFIDGEIDVQLMKNAIKRLHTKYSWDETGKSTVAAYRSIANRVPQELC